MVTLPQLRLALNLHNVSRFQAHRMQQKKSVAEHSFRVGLIYSYLGGTEILAALCHDIEESVTGDIPSPAKLHLTGLEYFTKLRVQFKDQRERRLGKLADKLELVLDLKEQLEDTGHLPSKLTKILDTELLEINKLTKELDNEAEVKKLLRDLRESKV